MWRFKNNDGHGEPGFVRMTDEFLGCNELFYAAIKSNPKQPSVFNRSGVGIDEVHHSAWIYSAAVAPTRNLWISVQALTDYIKRLNDIPDGYEEGEWEEAINQLILEQVIVKLLRFRRRQALKVLLCDDQVPDEHPVLRRQVAEEKAGDGKDYSPPFGDDAEVKEPTTKKSRFE